jgi:hypothetical protein
VRKTEPGDTIHQNVLHIGVSDGSVSGLVVREYRVLKDLDSRLSFFHILGNSTVLLYHPRYKLIFSNQLSNLFEMH